MKKELFSQYALGDITLANRAVMAPLTRCRAINNIPNDLMATYYQQRAQAGLIITEGTSPSLNGLGYARIPGIFNEEQKKGWQKSTQAVHDRGGHIFVQLMHTGRVSHPDNMAANSRILAPSAIAAPGEMWTDNAGNQAHPVPEAMSEKDIQEAIQEYAHAAQTAIDAGFDGVELHAANGYLIDQFLNTAANQRTDKWGGTIDNRIRFAVEVSRAVIAKIGKNRVGMRISPYGVFNGMQADAEMDNLYEQLIIALNKLGLLYIHIVDHSSMGAPEVNPATKQMIRETFKGSVILSGGYDAARAEQDLTENKGDLVAFGRLFLANPDLLEKFKHEQELTEPDADTFYTADEKGYTDYPVANV